MKNQQTHILTKKRLFASPARLMCAAIAAALTFISVLTGLSQSQILVPFNQEWKYNPNNSDLMTAWRDLTYDDSSWSSGTGPLGFPVGEALTGGSIGTSGLSIQTVLPQFSPVDASRVRTYYFRVKFVVTNNPSNITLVSSNLIDDAAVFYLNGVEIGRPGFNAGTVVTATSQGDRAADDVTVYGWDIFTNAAPTPLVMGTNILAVEVHQTGSSSSDLVFAHKMVALIPTPVSITVQPTNQIVPENRVVNLVANAAGYPLPTFQWYKDTNSPVAIPGATSPTYTITNTATSDTGDYFLVAMNSINSATSQVARLTVTSDTVPPHLLSITTDESFQRIILNWDETMLQGPAIELGNYYILDPNGNQVNVDSVDYNGSNVVLHVATMLHDTNYTIEIDYQQDLVGHLTDPVGNPQVDPANGVATSFHTWTITRGLTRFQAYLGLPSGQNIGAFVGMPIYPDRSTFSFYTNVLYWPQTAPNVEQYAMRFTGLFVPNESGTHQFNPAHDDDVRLRVYASENPNDTFMELAAACCTGLTDGPTLDVDLVAGNMYYYELIVREFGGGDYAGFSVTMPSSTVVSPANSAYLAIAADPAAAPNIGISVQPQSQTVAENHSLTFSVAVTNSGGAVAYQWQLQPNGGGGFTDIPGAVGSSYTTPLLTIANSGDQYRVLVGVPGKTITSSAATATVVTDVIAPQVVAVRGTRGLNGIQITYSEAMNLGSAIEVGNYTLTDTNGQNPLNLGTPTLSADLRTVTIPTTDPMSAGTFYQLQIADVADVAGNPIVPTNVVFETWVLTPGFLLFEAYNTGGGNAVANLTNSVLYPNSPDLVTYVPTFDSRNVYPTDSREGYGARISGYFIAPETTNYIFYLRSDDSSELWMNTSAVNSLDPAGATKIQEETGCCNPFSAHASASIPLNAGQAYYIQLLYKEGTGGDFGQAAFKTSGDPRNPDTLTPVSGAYLATLADPVGASITITQQPQNKTFVLASGATTLASETFNAGDGGYTVSNPTGGFEGPWAYDGARGSWHEDGEGTENSHPNTSLLASPSYAVTAFGNVVLNLTHRWSFEYDGTAWDGGQIRISVNGGPFVAVPASAFIQNGYSGTIASGSASDLKGQAGYISESPGYASGYVVTIANLGLFNPGDTIRLQFMAASDTNTRGQIPNWEIDQIDLTQGNGEPNVTFTVGAAGTISTTTNPPLAYQWYRNNGGGWVAIAGASSSSYSFIPVAGDNGAQFQAVVYVPGTSATSTAATLTVTTGGGTGPTVHVSRDGNQVTVTWTGGGTLQEATDLLNGGATAWTDVAGNPSGTYTTTAAGPRKFYRVRVP